MRPTIYCKPYLWLLTLAAIFHSCTETEYLEYEQETANRILEYRVTNATQELKGAIDQTDNTITVYVPYYLGIDYLVAEITLDQGASLLDSLGNEINLDGGLDPVPLGADPITYTVVGATGATREYTLIQEILPHSNPLYGWYTGSIGDTTSVSRAVHSRLTIYGNFESTSTNANFRLTDQATGATYNDFVSVYSVTPGNNYYTMVVNISPEAMSGSYDVVMEHQGRTTTLPDMHLRYKKPYCGTFLSSSAYAPGDTIVFNAMGYNSTDAMNGVFVGLDRIYTKLRKQYLTAIPTGFPEELYDQEIELPIVEWNRTQVKAIFPELPAGNYKCSYNWTYSSTEGYIWSYSGFAFYADFNAETDYGEDILIATASSLGFTVKEKE